MGPIWEGRTPPDRLITCCMESLASEILSLNLNHTSIHLSEESWRTLELCFNKSQRKQSAFDLLLEQQSVNDQGAGQTHRSTAKKGALLLLGCPSDGFALADCKDQLRRLAGNFVADLIIGSVQGEKAKISKFCESRCQIPSRKSRGLRSGLSESSNWLDNA
ncbi:predicted protein [Histoplasma capsulatum G186AR]|uniref:Uncharacterized protein n=1 Tax=Ajellomyces capsulatus (strain G186AR / H82 / ATCC MYA-2454 / RMSCC 2432) TaxID=447093 RepID=C0NBS6_AJECG|nr:uncharacterized protein HCBG_00572 [Histoplasma capsulatum G186AR]EEH11117.1 predicted protein [Histoplasma capsulatum G186AR]